VVRNKSVEFVGKIDFAPEGKRISDGFLPGKAAFSAATFDDELVSALLSHQGVMAANVHLLFRLSAQNAAAAEEATPREQIHASHQKR
jgi:hypothetical protein